ncbi:putative cysteine protease ATG4 [Cryptosporidium felis]|nr:putative cysteine protease ATG4 [Cryptosporidium felis]
MGLSKQIYYSIGHFLRNFIFKSLNAEENIFMLQKKYEPGERKLFLHEFRDFILFTYRNGFSDITEYIYSDDGHPLLQKNNSFAITTDFGWGCMYRVTQMAIYHGICIFLKKANNFDHNMRNIINNFQDNNSASFSIHNMVRVGLFEFGIKPTSWIGPTTSSIIANKLINSNKSVLSNVYIASLVFENGTIYRSKALKHFSEINQDSCSFIWICMKLGTSEFNGREYKETIISMSRITQFICIMGGNNYSSSALLILGFSNSLLYCLDPHIKTQPLFTDENYNRGDFVQEIPTQIYWEELNPSMAMVFTCKNLQDFDNLCIELSNVNPDLFEVINNEIEIKRIVGIDSGFLIL